MADMLPILLPLLLIIIAAGGSTRFGRKIPIRSRIYRFHVIFYPVVAMLGLVVASLMKLFSAFDRWVDDTTLFLQLVFGISGSVLCLGLGPVVWWVERRTDSTTISRIGKIAILATMLIPYFIIIGLLVFYRE